MATAKTVSQRAPAPPVRANVASVPTPNPTEYIEDDQILPAVEEVDYDFDTEEEEK